MIYRYRPAAGFLVSLGAEGMPLKFLSDTGSGCFALFGVNMKRLPESGQTRTRQMAVQAF
jgi:hypothetical protein